MWFEHQFYQTTYISCFKHPNELNADTSPLRMLQSEEVSMWKSAARRPCGGRILRGPGVTEPPQPDSWVRGQSCSFGPGDVISKREAGIGFSKQASNIALINKVEGGRGSRPQDIFPIWIFFQASEAVNMQESMMPATVNVPPTMAQIYRGENRG